MKLLSKAAFARLTRRKPSQITKFIERGLPVRGGKIPVAEGRRWIKDNIRSKRADARANPKRSTKVEEERILLRERAEKLRLENAERRGELCDKSELIHE